MAQPGSALAWGASGRWFKSSRPDSERAWSSAVLDGDFRPFVFASGARGGLILAHNVEVVLDYVRAVTTNPSSGSNACFKRETLRAAVRRGAAAP